jgi:hypothetical protein
MPLQGALVSAGGSAARTDIEGRYALSVSPAQKMRIEVSRSGYFAPGPLDTENPSAGQAQSRVFTLRPLLRISGSIDETGCQVFAFRRISALGRFWYTPYGLATSDTRAGKFEIRNLEPGDYVLEIVPENPGSEHCRGWSYYPDAGRLEMAAPISILATDTALNIKFAGRQLRWVSGALRMPSSLQLIRYVGDELRIVASLSQAKAGPFQIGGVPEGDYHLIAVTASGLTSDTAVTVTDGDVTGLSINPGPAAGITGTVRMDDGSPLPPNLRMSMTRTKPIRLISDTSVSNVSAEGSFILTADAAVSDLRTAIIGLPKDCAVRPDSTTLNWVLTRQRGTISGDAKQEDIVLMPGAILLSGVFSTRIAPGSYKVLRLSGDEKLLRADREFLKAKAEQCESVEIRPGQTTTLP